MKVLWFCNTPCGATEKLTGEKITGGGWLDALSKVVSRRKEIQLHIAFYWGEEISVFQYQGIWYHPILKKDDKSKLSRAIGRFQMVYNHKMYNVGCVVKLMNVISELNPDLIHIHGSEKNFGFISSKDVSCPIVLSIQGILSPYYYKLFSGFTKREVLKSENLLTKLIGSGIKQQEATMCKNAADERSFLSKIDYIIGRTYWDKMCSLALNPRREYFIVNEILRDVFYHNKWEKHPRHYPIELVSTVSNGLYKGVEMIFAVSKILMKGHFPFRWNIIGLNKNDRIIKLAKKKSKYEYDIENIVFRGRVEARGIVKILQESDLYIQVSHIENSPNSLCEAMIMGMPILASFAGGTSSILENNKEGMLIQSGEPYVLAGAIIDAAQRFQDFIDMGENARHRAVIRHNPDNVLKELLSCYSKILKCNDKI